MFRRARRTYVAGRQGRQQGAPARMPTRITVRYLGSEVGKKVARPDTEGELLELAAKRLNLSTPALRVFAEGGDEYDGDEDVVLIESDEIIYVSCGEDFGSTAPTGAPSAPPAAAAPAPTPPTAPQPAVLPHGTGPLDRLALPHWCLVCSLGGHKQTRYRIEVYAAEACTYIVRDLGQQPTTWMGTGCCSTGGNQQRSQQCAEQVLQPGKEPAR